MPPPGAILWDFSQVWSASAHLRFYDFYTRLTIWKWSDGSIAEWAILGGAFLDDVRGQSEIIDYQQRMDRRIQTRARTLCPRIPVGDTWTFEDGGSELMTADIESTNVRLTLSRFYLWWDAQCRIGPKQRDPDTGECFARYSGTVTWTLYDYYDFEWFEIYGYLGTPFHVHGSWTNIVAGTVTCPCGDERRRE